MEAGGQKIEGSSVLSDAFTTYSENAGALLGASVAVVGVGAVISAALSLPHSFPLVVLGALVSLAVQLLYTGFVVKLVEDARDGRRDHDAGRLLSAAAPALWPLLGAGILYGIAVAIGLALLIVPGLVLITIWAVIAPAIVVEHAGAIEAFGRSRELVRGNAWAVFGVMVIAFLFVPFVVLISGLVTTPAGQAVSTVATIIAIVVTTPIPALVSSILFFELGGGALPNRFEEQHRGGD